MKTLTIKNPWAMLIAAGIKDIENRTWRTKFRGRIYIHAGAYKQKAGSPNPLNVLQWEEVKETNGFLADQIADNTLIRSAIIGEVDIVDCVLNAPSIWAEKTDLSEGAIFKPIWNLVLANPVLYDKPIENVKGKLSFWNAELL